MTERKRTEWQEKIYLLQNKLGIGAEEGAFCCEYFDDCNRSVEPALSEGRKGDWAYVGSHYGSASVGGKPARVLFVGMDRPGKGGGNSLEYFRTQTEWREGARYRGNPHMGGVDAELEYLVEDGTSPDDRCRQFALVNAVFCGPPAKRGPKGELMVSNVSETMKGRCRKQLQKMLLAFEPDIVIAQGKGHPLGVCTAFGCKIVKRWASKTLPTWAVGHKPPERNRLSDVAKGEIGGRPVWFLITTHPSNYALLGLPFWKHDAGAMPDELTGAFDFVRERYAG